MVSKFPPAVLRKYSGHRDFIGMQLTDINQPGLCFDAPLHLAVLAGDPEDVGALLAAGADINQAGEHGNTPLHYAMLMRHTSIVKILLTHGADPFSTNARNQTPAELGSLVSFHEGIDLIRNLNDY